LSGGEPKGLGGMTGSCPGPGFIFSSMLLGGEGEEGGEGKERGERGGRGRATAATGSTPAPTAPGAPTGMPVVVGAAVAEMSSSVVKHPDEAMATIKNAGGANDRRQLRTRLR
jgi:hypothetical protein